jgi:hypothetical protein
LAEVIRVTKTNGHASPLFVHQASVEAGNAFFAKRAPDARAIADCDGTLFSAFALQRGSLMQLLGPRVIWSGLKAFFRGHMVGIPTSDPTRLSGCFLVHNREVLWSFRAQHTGDLPAPELLSQALQSHVALP